MEGCNYWNFGRLGISCFNEEGIWKIHPKSWESFLHIPSPTWAVLRPPYARGLGYHLFSRDPIKLTKYSFNICMKINITPSYYVEMSKWGYSNLAPKMNFKMPILNTKYVPKYCTLRQDAWHRKWQYWVWKN